MLRISDIACLHFGLFEEISVNIVLQVAVDVGFFSVGLHFFFSTSESELRLWAQLDVYFMNSLRVK